MAISLQCWFCWVLEDEARRPPSYFSVHLFCLEKVNIVDILWRFVFTLKHAKLVIKNTRRIFWFRLLYKVYEKKKGLRCSRKRDPIKN